MKTLYIVRHAKSSWSDPSLSDHDRPLNNRGKKNAPEMGLRLKHLGILPDVMISSSANRALTTAREIASAIGYPQENITITRDLYHAGENNILHMLHSLDNSYNSVMIFGHNPGFTWFANALGDLDIDNIPTAGIVSLQFDVDSWFQLAYGKGKLEFFDYPKKPFSF